MKLYVIAGRGGGVQETAIRSFGQWELFHFKQTSLAVPLSKKHGTVKRLIKSQVLQTSLQWLCQISMQNSFLPLIGLN